MRETSVVRPQLSVLSAEQMARVHDASLQILSSIGVRVESEPAREIFARAIGGPADEERVRIPPALVERALETAPASVDVYDRRGDLAFRLGDGEARFGIGVTALYYQEPATDEVVPFAREHVAAISRLAGVLDSFDLISTPGIVQDVPADLSDLYATLEMVANTVKPLSILVSEDERYDQVLDLAEHLRRWDTTRDLASRPFIVPYFNPITPLVMNAGTLDKMLTTIERGLPFMYSNYGMVGATTPITPAGTFALLNAELLAGLVFSQLAREGAPVIVGCLPAYFNMRGMGSFYDPTSYVIDLACAEMMVHYGLPHCGTSGSGMGWGADLIAAGHQWMNHLISSISKVGLAPFVGDNLGSKAFSPAMVVHADEIIAQARRFAEGFALDEVSLALDEIERIGAGGHFLASDLTFEHFHEAYFESEIWPSLTLEEWQARGSPRAEDELRAYTQELLAEASAPADHDELMARGEGFISQVTS